VSLYARETEATIISTKEGLTTTTKATIISTKEGITTTTKATIISIKEVGISFIW
jgi:transposase